MISLAGGLPDPDLFPAPELADLAAGALRSSPEDCLQYGLTKGSTALRETISAGMTASAGVDDVIVTTGSQQALALLATTLLDPDDEVVVGDPDYLGALQAFRGRGARLVPLPIGIDGIDVDALESHLRQGGRPKLVYVVPHFHNPTGATLGANGRARLLALAERHGFVVVFDDPYRELTTGETDTDEPGPHPSAIELRSVSKVLAPGLRVGWMTGPREIIDAAELAKQAVDLHTSSLDQAIVLGALRAPWFPDHLARLRETTRVRRDALTTALTDRLGERVRFDPPSGGMFVWARFVDGTDTGELLTAALDRGVAFVPGAAFAVARDLRSHLRLSWATTDPSHLDEAVRRLAG